MHVHRGDSANGKSISAVAIGHAKRVTCDPGQCGDVADLFVNRLVHFTNQFFGRNDPRWHAHPLLVARGELPNTVRNFLQLINDGHAKSYPLLFLSLAPFLK